MTRNKQFDILAAIGILFVVIGHCGGVTILPHWFSIYSFHMPLFLFISGYFYHIENQKNIKGTLINKVKKFVIPYFAWNLFYMCFLILVTKTGLVGLQANITLYNFFIEPFVHGNQFYFNHPSWFLLSLFLIQVVYLLIRKVLSFLYAENEWGILFITFILGTCAVYVSYLGYKSGLGLVLTKIFLGMFFYHLGYLYKVKLEEVDVSRNTRYFFCVFLIQLILLFITKGNTRISMWNGDYNNTPYSFMPFLTALPAIAFYLRVSKILVPAVENNKTVCMIGQNTFSIMMHHQFTFFLINFVFFIVNIFVDLPQFDLYHASSWYFYFFGNEQFRMVYLAAGMTVPIVIEKGSKNFVKYIKSTVYIKGSH